MSARRRPWGSTVGGLVAFVVGLALMVGLGYAFCVSAVGVWRGTLTAATADGIPGQVSDVACGRKRACSGSFASDDGTIRLERVRIASAAPEQGQHGELVRAIDMGPVDGPNSQDTVYTDGVRFVVVGYVFLALLLTACALVAAGTPLLFLIGLALDPLIKRRRREPDD